MSYMRSTDSAVLQEFGRILQEKEGLKKSAQVAAPLSPEQQAAWARVMQGHGPGTKAWNNAEALLKSNPAYAELMAKAKDVYFNGSENDAMAWKKLLDGAAQSPQMAKQPAPAPAPIAAVPPARAALSAREKTADQKAYDVTGKEDMVAEAHPGKAMVEGELVENLNQQQDADKAVAEKSAKNILVALYKLAKRLKAENNERAYALVKETFLDLSKSLKK
jgi:hypothetical protein